MNKKNIFIFGISGQDGSYLAHFLIKKNFNVIGFSRSNNKNNFINLKRLNILQKVKLIKYNDNNERLVEKKLLKFQPSQIYMLSGLSSVSKSFSQPIETYKSNIITLFKILEFCRKKKLKINIYNSASTDCFGNQKKICNENSEFFPVSPYAKSKSYVFWLVKYYRETFKLNCVSGIISNHESLLRPNNFVSKKIIEFVKNFKKNKKLIMGNTNIYRDWGWAPDFVEAIYRINSSKIKTDYIVATGKTISLDEFIKKVFHVAKIDKNNYIKNNKSYIRKKEIKKIYCSNKKIREQLGWKPKHNLNQIIKKLLNNQLF